MKRFAMLILIVTAGCAGVQRGMGILAPGAGVDDRMVSRFCQSRAAYDGFLEDAKGHQRGWRPTVGMSACQVLALVGKPDDESIVEGSGYASRHWTYFSGSGYSTDAHLVTIEHDENRFGVVASVVW